MTLGNEIDHRSLEDSLYILQLINDGRLITDFTESSEEAFRVGIECGRAEILAEYMKLKEEE